MIFLTCSSSVDPCEILRLKEIDKEEEVELCVGDDKDEVAVELEGGEYEKLLVNSLHRFNSFERFLKSKEVLID